MRHKTIFGSIAWLIAVSLLLSACGGIALPDQATQNVDQERPTATVESTSAAPTDQAGQTESSLSCEEPFADTDISFVPGYWDQTDFCQHSVPLSEFQSGGPPPDGIQPIDNPKFVDQDAGDEWLGAEWPVIAFEHEGEAKAYPLAILLLHEIVNDEVGGKPVAVTYCPLCNAAIVFDREVDGQVLDFGTTGNLRNSDLVMYDRQTQSWWQQLTGEAVVGSLTGTQLEFLSSRTISWEDFKDRFPEGDVLSRDSGIDRYRDLYGQNPYPGLDSANTGPFGVSADDRLESMERVVAVELEGQPVAYPFSRLQQIIVLNDEIGETPIVVFWQSGVKSAVDSRQIANSRDVGSTAVYRRTVGDQLLTFNLSGEEKIFTDEETGSSWNIFGEAISGPLEGEQLEQIVSAEHFWFAWSAFKGDTEIRPSDGNEQ
ncbi:MAG: DUF3179 domain-containing protein [Anaerolineales bacterium]